MMKIEARALVAALPLVWLAGSAHAMEGVVASIKPVHSLVAAVMGDTGDPALIVRGAASPHGYSLRPSDAKALENARLVFWVGPELEPFLEKPLATLAGDAATVALAEVPGISTLPMREGGTFEPHQHEGEEEHDHADEVDPHVWLDPQNAKAMTEAIAVALAKADPDNAQTYRDNAAAVEARLDALTAEISRELEPVKDRNFIVFHDAYHYFENRFGLQAAGSITVTPEVLPGAARLSEIRDKVRSLDAVCIFAEPQFDPVLVQVAAEGTDARTGSLDPIGMAIEPGASLYFELLRGLAGSVRDCLSKSS